MLAGIYASATGWVVEVEDPSLDDQPGADPTLSVVDDVDHLVHA
jgi:hypothetical protein